MKRDLTCPSCHARTMRSWEEEHMSLPIHEGALSYVEVWQIDMCDNRACGYFKQEKTG